MFKVNEGPMDRLARAIVGVVLLFLALATTGGLQILLFVLAAICLLTAVTGFCGIYALFKINTTKKTLTPSEEVKVADEAEAKVADAESSGVLKEETTNVMSEPELIPKEDPETIIKPEEPIEIETPEVSNQPEDLSSEASAQEEEKPILL